MIGTPTGLTKDIQCACGSITSQYQLDYGTEFDSRGRARETRRRAWVSKFHNAPCGKPCSLSPGALAGDCHLQGKCEACPTPSGSRRGPRARLTATATASPILGQLTVNEARVAYQILHIAISTGRRRVSNLELCQGLQMPDATVRGTLRRLAVRGFVFKAKHTWNLNLADGVTHEELAR